MFGIGKLEKRIKNLEEKFRNQEIKETCAKGEHKWIMASADSKNPLVRCEYCYAVPEKLK